MLCCILNTSLFFLQKYTKWNWLKSHIYTYMKQFETLAILISSKTNETCKAITASGKNLIKI